MRAGGDAFGIALRTHQAGDWRRAAVAYQKLLRKQPDHAGAWHLLGVARQQDGDSAEAVRCIGRAISLDGSNAVYFGNLGTALKSLGRRSEAEQAYRQAILLRPCYTDALSNLALLLHEDDRGEEALGLFGRALALNPSHADALYSLANLQRDRGCTEEAVALYRRAMAARSGWAAAHNNLAGSLQSLGRLPEAIEQFRRAVALAPGYAEAHLNLGAAYAEQDRVDEAAECFRRASQLRPDKAIWRARAACLCPIIFDSTDGIQKYRQELGRQLDAIRVPPSQRWEDLAADGFAPSFNLKHHGADSRTLKEKFARVFEPLFPQARPRLGRGKPRVGFLVTGRHEGGLLRAMGGIIEQLDRQRFEVVLFCSQAALATCQAGIQRTDLEWVPFADDLGRAARRIREAACDLVYHRQIGTDVVNYFLPFARLAPVQCTSWGSHVTTGITAVDWFLSSALTEPEDAEAHYSERLHRFQTLPEYHRRPAPFAPASRHEFGLPEDRRIYFCPGHLAKFHPDFDRLLETVLRSDPQGVLVLVAEPQDHGMRLLQARFERRLGAVAQRVLFLPRQSPEGFRRLMSVADVMLDTWHYSASLMAYDAFGAGLPIVTLPDGFNVGRTTMGLYRKMELEGLVAKSPEDYVAKALAWAVNRDERKAVQVQIIERREVLYEDRRLVQEHEQFFEQAMEEARRREE